MNNVRTGNEGIVQFKLLNKDCKENIVTQLLSRLIQGEKKLKPSRLRAVLYLSATDKEMNKLVDERLRLGDVVESYLKTRCGWDKEDNKRIDARTYYEDVDTYFVEYATLLKLSFRSVDSLECKKFQKRYLAACRHQFGLSKFSVTNVIFFENLEKKFKLTSIPILAIENILKLYLNDGSLEFVLKNIFRNTILVQNSSMTYRFENQKLYINSQSLGSIITKAINWLDRDNYNNIPKVLELFFLVENLSMNDSSFDLLIQKIINSQEGSFADQWMYLLRSGTMRSDLGEKILSSILDRSLDEGLSLIDDLIKKEFFTTNAKAENSMLIKVVMKLLNGDYDRKKCGEKILEKMSLAGIDGWEMRLLKLYSLAINIFLSVPAFVIYLFILLITSVKS